MPDRYVYSASYIYSAQASEMGVRAVFVYASGIYPIWAKHASTCRTRASTDMKRADTISDTDSIYEGDACLTIFGFWIVVNVGLC